MKQEKTVPGRENKPHIGIFGRCNSGKSSLLNFITDADTAIVSPEKGTTTDVVRKSYEILDFAPVIFIDTAGIDDCSKLAEKRIQRTLETINQIDLALLVYTTWGDEENRLISLFEKMSVSYVLVYNNFKSEKPIVLPDIGGSKVNHVVSVDASGSSSLEREALLDEIKKTLPEKSYKTPSMFANMVEMGDYVLLVCPIDSEAPAGRLILPQVQAIRELLDRHAVPIVVQPEQIENILQNNVPLKLVVVDSQVYAEVRRIVPKHIDVTSFSILLAAAKGDYELYQKGLQKIDTLKTGDRVLIAESCTHQVSCDDIGRVKIPQWLESYTGKKLEFTVISGLSPLPEDLSSYSLMVQCGGCMVTRSQLHNRIRAAVNAGVAVTNYGMLIRKVR